MSGIKFRLSTMMFLQYCVWGIWAPILAIYLGGLEDFRAETGWKINMVYMTMAIASMISPLIAGQFVDRYFATEKYLAFSHFAGGLTLYWAAQITDFQGLFWVMLLHSIFYAPTVSLTNSLAFSHLPNGEKDFGFIRMFGTVGWIFIGVVFSFWLGLPDDWKESLPVIPDVGHCLIGGAAVSMIMAVYCLTLPHTPPMPRVSRPFAFLEAFKLAKDRSFAVLLAVAFLVSTELQFYYVLTPNFFLDQPAPTLTQSQLVEAGGFEGEEGAEQATLLMRLLDTSSPRNRKLTREEIQQADERKTELELIRLNLPDEGGPFGDDAVKNAAREAGLVTEGRDAESIAKYAITAVDTPGEPDQKLTAEEIDDFLARVNPLLPKLGDVASAFDDIATTKGGLELPARWVGRVMLLGQVMEILVLLMLPFALARLGFGTTIAIGIAAWALRYALFALGDPKWLVISSQALHGIGFGFFFVGSMIYVDRIAPKDIRGSAQALFIFITYGAGMVVSSLFAGPVADYFDFDWNMIFMVPVAITTACTLIFLIGFRETPASPSPLDATPGEQREGPEVS